jgi:hypothetical protein
MVAKRVFDRQLGCGPDALVVTLDEHDPAAPAHEPRRRHRPRAAPHYGRARVAVLRSDVTVASKDGVHLGFVERGPVRYDELMAHAVR